MTKAFAVGGMWEDREFEIRSYEMVNKQCPHTYPNQNSNSHIWSYICPRVVVSMNEGGHNSTGVCLDCILDAAKTLNEIPS